VRFGENHRGLSPYHIYCFKLVFLCTVHATVQTPINITM
jgi:hypothetical protein